MVPYLLDFHENIRFSKTLKKYQEQPYPIEKTTIAFLDLPKRACNIHRIFMEQSGNITIFNIPNIPRDFIGNFLRMYWEYLKGMPHKDSTNIYLPGG